MTYLARTIASRNFVGWALLAALVGCGPRHQDGDGGAGGAAGSGMSGGAAGSGVAGGEGGVSGEGGAAEGGASGASGSVSAGTGGTAGSSGSGGSGDGGRLGYDSVIGCPAPRYADDARLTLVPAQPEISLAKLSGDGRVVGGQVESFGSTFRWRPESGIEAVEGLRYGVSNLSCDGSVLLTADTSGGSWRHRVGEEAQQVIPGGDYFQPQPLSLTPDGSVVVGHLVGYADLGPHPVRWTAATGLEPITALDNTLVQGVAPDGNTVLGLDLLRIFRFTLGGTKEFVQGWVPSDGYSVTRLVVSANAQTYVFNATPTYRSLFVDSIRSEVDCPSVRCEPIALSGTGKVLMARGPIGPEVGAPWVTFVWTARHGFRTLDDLMSELGAPAPGVLLADDMSDDGQVFTGFMTEAGGAPHRKFYAVLPPAAYD